MPPSRPDIAIVGCGAIAQAFYIPALRSLRDRFGDIWLVDPSERARSAAMSMISGMPAEKLADVPRAIHAAVIATPNAYHFGVALEALSRGAHVLIEKPFVIWPDEGRKLLSAASSGRQVVAVNQTRRTFPATNELRKRINAGEFGGLVSVTHHEGTKLDWPFESGVGFSPGAVRTGVIMDFGVHVIDLYQYLLSPAWTFVDGIHDGFDGPEGLAEIRLLAGEAPMSLRLSRYLTQNNIAHLSFEAADISFHVYEDSVYTVRRKGGSQQVFRSARTSSAGRTNAEALLLNFLDACDGRCSPYCDAESSLPVIRILDTIYQESTRYPSAVGAV